MFGLLNLDKPSGMTSRDAVNRVQRLVKPHKVGHAGTLDPLATGVLVVALGSATRLVEYIQRMPKTYRVTFLLGRTSDTEDVEGEVVELTNVGVPSEEQIRAAASRFIGTIKQRPPAYSAVKVGGRRAYQRARSGEAVELAPRSVEIYAIELVRYSYPELELLIRCGSGTYIRSLGRDLARSLGTDAIMSALRREAIGPFYVDGAVPYDQLSTDVINRQLLPAVLAVGDLPQIEITPDERRRLALGQAIADRWALAAPEGSAIDAAGCLVSVVARRNGCLAPLKCFVQP